MSIEIIIFLCSVSIILWIMLLSWLVYNKLSSGIDRLSKQLVVDSGNVIAQVESLLSLQTELKLNHALPPARGWAASPDFLCNLFVHTLKFRPRSVVECSSGISTVVLARCMEIIGEGHVYSLEHDAEYAVKTRDLLQLHGLSKFATVCNAPLESIELDKWSGQWYSHEVLPEDLRIDLLVVDGPPWFVAKTARYPAVPVLHDRFNRNAAVFLDDAARMDEKIAVKMWLEEFPDLALFDVPKCEKGCVAIRKLSDL